MVDSERDAGGKYESIKPCIGCPKRPRPIYRAKEKRIILITKRGTPIVFSSESCGRRIFPIRYNPVRKTITTQVARTNGLVKISQPQTRSVLLKNLNAAAISRKPIDTFTALSHPPLFGILDKY